jgi:hypothetical protein
MRELAKEELAMVWGGPPAESNDPILRAARDALMAEELALRQCQDMSDLDHMSRIDHMWPSLEILPRLAKFKWWR